MPRPFFKIRCELIQRPQTFCQAWEWLHLQTTPLLSSLGVTSFSRLGVASYTDQAPTHLRSYFLRNKKGGASLLSDLALSFKLGVASPTCLPHHNFLLPKRGVALLNHKPRPLFPMRKKVNTMEIIERLLHMVFSYSIFPTFKKPKMPYHYFYYERKIITA